MPVAVAETFQSHKSIYQAARSFMRNHVSPQHSTKPEVKAGKLDSRLKLKKCNKRLQAFLPKGSRELGKTTVGVKCAGTNPWSLHVPVTISVYKNIVVTTRLLQKGTVLAEPDIKLVKRDLGNLSYGYFEDISSNVGMKLKRRTLAGAVLTPAMLKKPQVISRGQKISILAQSGRMQVRMTGKALANGAVGERIKVMNLKSSQKLEGVVTSAGVVEIDI